MVKSKSIQEHWESAVPFEGPLDTPCMFLSRATNSHGYVQIKVSGRARFAHLVFYEEFICAVPSPLKLDHLCRERACCNPWHCEPVTNRENILRGIGHTAINAAKTHCARGHELSGENVKHRLNGQRQCVSCKKMTDADYARRNRVKRTIAMREWRRKSRLEQRP